MWCCSSCGSMWCGSLCVICMRESWQNIKDQPVCCNSWRCQNENGKKLVWISSWDCHIHGMVMILVCWGFLHIIRTCCNCLQSQHLVLPKYCSFASPCKFTVNWLKHHDSTLEGRQELIASIISNSRDNVLQSTIAYRVNLIWWTRNRSDSTTRLKQYCTPSINCAPGMYTYWPTKDHS